MQLTRGLPTPTKARWWRLRSVAMLSLLPERCCHLPRCHYVALGETERSIPRRGCIAGMSLPTRVDFSDAITPPSVPEAAGQSQDSPVNAANSDELGRLIIRTHAEDQALRKRAVELDCASVTPGESP
ncbi:MAG: hypothetical protein ACREXR_05435 [Gammaproteobacteria bacterium]